MQTGQAHRILIDINSSGELETKDLMAPALGVAMRCDPCIGCHVQALIKKLYNLERSFMRDGSQFDQLFMHGKAFMIGRVQATAMLVPGHTPADLAYRIDNSVASARRHAHGADVDSAVDL